MRKLFALILALVMMLTCAAASANSTVDVKINADREQLKTVMQKSNSPEETISVVDAVVALVNALGIKVASVEDGAEIALSLNGEEALTLGFSADEEGAALVSSMFPNHYLTISKEMLKGLMQSVPGVGSDAEGGVAGGIAGGMTLPESTQAYFNDFVQTCTAAIVPGEPVKGEYQFDGVNFDTQVPVNIDVPAIKEAFGKLTEQLTEDEAFMSMLQGYMKGGNFDKDKFKQSMNEFLDHFPEAVSAEYDANGEEKVPYYVCGRAGSEGADPVYEYTMLCKDEKTYTVSYMNHEKEIVAGVVITEGNVRVEVKQKEDTFAVNFAYETGEPSKYVCDFFFGSDTPLATVTVTVSAEGQRTLEMSAEGKTTISMEDMQSGQGDGVQTFMSEIQNGLMTLITSVMQAVPESAPLIQSLFQGGQQ